MGLRVGPEVGQQRQPVLGGQPQAALRPEVVELRHREIQSGGPLVVQVRQPLPRGAAFGELFAEAERLGQRGERRVVVTGLRVRLGHFRHGHQQRVVA